MQPNAQRISLGTIASYGLPAVSGGFTGGLISFYLLKFSTDVLLIAPGLMGLLFGLSRVWDAVSDPLAGYWSDRTRSRLGRRRSWIAVSALPLAISFAALWVPPRALDGAGLVAWMGFGLLLFYGAQTALFVPHAALGAEITADHHDRSRVFAGRMLFDVSGFFLAVGALHLLERAADPRALAGRVALVGAALTTALTLLSVALVREPAAHQGRGAASPWQAFGDVLRNRHARILLAVFFLETLGFTAMITAMPYATQYVLRMPGRTSLLLGGAVLTMIATVPAWLALSRRLGKRSTWLGTLIVRSLGFAAIFLTPPEHALPTLIGVVAIGSAYAGGMILGPSLKADVIDCDELRTDQRKEGAYFASWNLAMKAGAAVAIALTGLALELAGFRANAEQGAGAARVIMGLFAGFPCLFYALAALILLRLRLGEREHAAVRAALAAREADEHGVRHSSV